jgi:calcineurin-like phosphoesterase family protein
MQNIFFTSDTHLNHTNIIKFCNRPFSNVEEMNEMIVKNWNAVVKPNDKIFHLGDFGFGRECELLFKRLNGHKYILKGNHDKDSTYDWDWDGVKDVHLLKYDDNLIWLSHYPHRSWPHSFHGSWHLFGHVHGRMEPYGLSMDVGVDVFDFTPVSYSVVKEKMSKLNQREQNNDESGEV